MEATSLEFWLRYVNFEDEIYFKGGRNVISTIFMLTDIHDNLIIKEMKREIWGKQLKKKGKL